MDFQSIMNFVLPTACAALGWFYRELWTSVQELKNDMAKLRAELPTHYVSKEDFNDRWNEVLKSLHRIEDKLDKKVDR
jgi:hypothetical protein